MDGEKKSKMSLKINWMIVSICLTVALIVGVFFDMLTDKIDDLEYQLKEAERSIPAMVVTNEPEPIVKKYEITIDYLKSSISTMSNLETSEVFITGICGFEEGSNFLTKNSYSMLYNAKVKAYVDVSKIEFEITDRYVIITLPRAEIEKPSIDPNSVRFYDIKKSLFNPVELDDSINSVRIVVEDIEQNYDFTEVLKSADKQAEYIIRTMFTDIVKQAEGERDLKIEWFE